MTSPHVLVARLDNAGDVLLTGPTVRAVAAGARRVTFLCGPAGRAAAELLPGVDAVEEFDAPWVSFSPPPVSRPAVEALVDRLAGLDVDRALVLTSFHQSPLPLALLLRLAGVPEVAATSVDYPGSLLDARQPVLDGAHEVEQALAVAGSLGHHLPGGDDGRLAVRRPLPEWRPFDRPYVCIHPGASVPARSWDPDRARRLVPLLLDAGWAVAVTGSEGERPLTARVAGGVHGDVADLGGSLDLRGLAGVLEGAAVLVSGNTGPAHLAAAVGTPVACIFPPVVPAYRWRPWRVPTVLLGNQHVPCAGCRARTCPIPGQPCLDGVTPESVAAAVHALVAGGGARHESLAVGA